MRLEADVCVVGAGPAGATFATRMAQLGYQVILLERSLFPRPHVGEAMTPAVWDLLESSGARRAVEELQMVQTPRAQVRWVDDRAHLVDSPIGRSGFTIDRSEFDQALLETAISVGVSVLQPASGASPKRTAGGWEIALSGLPTASSVCARFLADATGRAGLIPGRRIRSSPRTISLDGLWSFDGAVNYETQIEARPEGWYWGAHLPGHTFRAMAFIDPDLLRRRQIGKPELETFYRTLLAGTQLLRALKRPRLEGRVIARDATCYYDPAPIDSTSIKLGESAFAIDPLSSSGVQKALQTSLAGSIAANTILAGGDVSAAIDFYLDNHRRSVVRHAEWAARHYREHRRYRAESFWLRRSRKPAVAVGQHRRAKPKTDAGEGVRLAPGARIVRAPCAVGDRVEMRDAFAHAGLSRPVAFLNGVDLAPLIEVLVSSNPHVGFSASGLIRYERGNSIVSWLVQQGVLETVNLDTRSAKP